MSKYNIGFYLRHTEDNGEIVIWFSQVYGTFLQDIQSGSESQVASYSMRTGCFSSAAKLAQAWS